jgi:hypothetical protein
MNSGEQKFRLIEWWVVALVLVTLVFGEWGSISAQTQTERIDRKALSDLKIKPGPEPNIPMPAIYNSPPRIIEHIVGGKTEFRLFYFCKYHTSDELRKIVHDQFATKIFDAKGKATEVPSYTVNSNPATNQLIVRCASREDIEAVLETLEHVDIQPVQVKIDCLISEVYADMTFDRETTIEIANLLGENITLKPGGTPFGASVRQLVLDDTYLPAFPGASLREVARSRMGLNIGYLSTSRAFTVLVDLLESRGYLKILMNPTLEVVNGKTAKVSSRQKVPIDRITMRSTQSDYLETKTEYEDVIDSLEITPHVFGDGYIALETSIVLGSKNTPEGVKQVPIITKKEITNKENRIRQGESLIIGGMRKNEEFGVVRGVPILKDLPLIGFLFSGEDTEQRAVETIFILTPTISTGGAPREEVTKDIKKKHEPASPEGLQKSMADVFGAKAREEEQKLKTQEEEQSRKQADAEKAEARSAAREAEDRADRAETELNRVKTQADRIKGEAEKAVEEADAKVKAAEEAKTAADKAAADAAKAKEQADKAKAQAEEKAKAAEKALAEANASAKAAEQDEEAADAEKTSPEANKARARSNRKPKADEKAEAEADAKTETDDKADVEADAKTTAAEKAGKEEGTTETQKSQEEGAEKAEAEKDKADAKEA